MLSKINRLTLFTYAFFGIPWTLSALVFAPGIMGHRLVFWVYFLLAYVSLRTMGMGLNRVIDVEIDGKNPRTRNRPLQVKLVTRREVWALAGVSAIVFVWSCAQLSWLCLWLSPIALFQVSLYSYLKRWTASCHIFLGSIHFFSPIFAYAAVTNTLHMAPLLLGLSLWLLITGNDILYAIEDMDFDREEGLKSIPVFFGKGNSMVWVRACYGLSLLVLFYLGIVQQLGPVYYFFLCLASFVLGIGGDFALMNTGVGVFVCLGLWGDWLWTRL